ncbi:ATP-dependent RNA helicase MAK5 [Nakaseomyces bracarensis]|uniref:RNA helicase n=1 Tax=Nakaseomyces bracarensis TaxID=273131 RepID=A0ABR4NN35_9SACH
MGKIVTDKDLRWKKVDIPDTLDDFGGFYGLEEIDGVGVRVVDGQVQFIANEDNVREEGEEESDDFPDFDAMEDGSDEGSDSDEDKANDDDSAVSKDQERKEDAAEEQEEEQGDDDDLKANVFSAMDMDLEDVSVDLPGWTETVDLSMTTVNGLSRLGFQNMTNIQRMAIPPALKGEDIMGKASTGSGKTLAYGIPIIEKMVACKDKSQTNGIIFTPTRELAQQVTKHLTLVCELLMKKNPYMILSLTGGLSIQKQERLLKYDGGGRIVVATPGRFLELLEKNPPLVKRFAKTDILVLDEADRLLQDGHFDEFEKILKHLSVQRRAQHIKTHWQTMIFSATFSTELFDKLASGSWKKKGNEDESEMEAVLKHLMKKVHFKSKPLLLDANPNDKISSQIKESLIECAPLERDLYCYYFVTMYPGTTLIFCNAIDSVKKLNVFLINLGINSFQIHSSMTQKNRLKNLEKFEAMAQKNNHIGKPTVLIASDVAARGLDIKGIKHVIHYHLPRSADMYIHRSGRTARGENEGVAVMICSPQESMGPLRKLRRILASKSEQSNRGYKKKWQQTVPLLPIEMDILQQLKDRSTLASELADHEIASKSLKKDDNWLRNAADELGIDIDSEDEEKDIILAKNKNKKLNKAMGKDEAKAIRAELNNLLRMPIRKDLRRSYLTGGLVNLADSLVKKRGHNNIIGYEMKDALDVLKNGKKNKKQKTK